VNDACNDIKLSANPQNLKQSALVDEEFAWPVHHIHQDCAEIEIMILPVSANFH
jgi:hypothetical protein